MGGLSTCLAWNTAAAAAAAAAAIRQGSAKHKSSSGSGSSSSQQSADEGVAVQPRQPIEVLLPAVVEAAVARRYEFSLQVRNIPFDIPLVLAWPYLRVTCINTAYGAKPLA
jgi:hypothetical protein